MKTLLLTSLIAVQLQDAEYPVNNGTSLPLLPISISKMKLTASFHASLHTVSRTQQFLER